MSWHEGCAAAASAGAHLSGMACMSGRAPWCRVRAASGAHRTAPMPAHRWSHRRPHGLKRLPPPACVSCTLPSPQCKTSFPMAKQSNANPAFCSAAPRRRGRRDAHVSHLHMLHAHLSSRRAPHSDYQACEACGASSEGGFNLRTCGPQRSARPAQSVAHVGQVCAPPAHARSRHPAAAAAAWRCRRSARRSNIPSAMQTPPELGSP